MPLRDFTCDSCGVSQERYYHPANEQTDPTYPPCESCGGTLTVLPLSQPSRRYVGSVFPFDTPHISPDGKPMTIESMGHLREVERKYGVVLSAFSKASIRDIDPIKDLPRYRGYDPDFER